MDYDIAIVGIGKVGLPLGLSLCSVGFKVLGLDINEDTVTAVSETVVVK